MTLAVEPDPRQSVRTGRQGDFTQRRHEGAAYGVWFELHRVPFWKKGGVMPDRDDTLQSPILGVPSPCHAGHSDRPKAGQPAVVRPTINELIFYSAKQVFHAICSIHFQGV